jgi:hypothetical protein
MRLAAELNGVEDEARRAEIRASIQAEVDAGRAKALARPSVKLGSGHSPIRVCQSRGR